MGFCVSSRAFQRAAPHVQVQIQAMEQRLPKQQEVVTESARAHSHIFSQEVQKTGQFWLLTFWLLTVPSALRL